MHSFIVDVIVIEVFGSFDGAMRQHVTSVCVCVRVRIFVNLLLC